MKVSQSADREPGHPDRNHDAALDNVGHGRRTSTRSRISARRTQAEARSLATILRSLARDAGRSTLVGVSVMGSSDVAMSFPLHQELDELRVVPNKSQQSVAQRLHQRLLFQFA